jgi:hypothetical protein
MVCTFSGLFFPRFPIFYLEDYTAAGVSRVQVLLLERFAFAEEDGERGRA